MSKVIENLERGIKQPMIEIAGSFYYPLARRDKKGQWSLGPREKAVGGQLSEASMAKL